MQNDRPKPQQIDTDTTARPGPEKSRGDSLRDQQSTVPRPIVVDHGSTPPLPGAVPFPLGRK